MLQCCVFGVGGSVVGSCCAVVLFCCGVLGWLFKLVLGCSLAPMQCNVWGEWSERVAFEGKIVMLKVWAKLVLWGMFWGGAAWMCFGCIFGVCFGM